MPVVWIGLGSNLGDRLAMMQAAVSRLAGDIEWSAISRVYQTEPMYVTDQPAFLNAVAGGTTQLGPLAMLARLKEIETQLGRGTGFRNGPREIDLDLLTYGGLELRSGERLILPHPRISERRFVLAPWAEVAPEFELPGRGTVLDLLSQTNDPTDSVQPLPDAVLFI